MWPIYYQKWINQLLAWKKLSIAIHPHFEIPEKIVALNSKNLRYHKSPKCGTWTNKAKNSFENCKIFSEIDKKFKKNLSVYAERSFSQMIEKK